MKWTNTKRKSYFPIDGISESGPVKKKKNEREEIQGQEPLLCLKETFQVSNQEVNWKPRGGISKVQSLKCCVWITTFEYCRVSTHDSFFMPYCLRSENTSTIHNCRAG